MAEVDTQEVARLESMIAFDIDENGGALTETKKAELEARLSILRGDPEADEEDAALRSLRGGVTTELSRHVESDASRQPATPEFRGEKPEVVSAPAPGGGVEADMAEIRRQLAELASGVQQVTTPPPTITLKDVLDNLDPRDSAAALALFNWLWDNKRFGVVGTLNGGGYLLHYQEPQGTSQAGYIAGGTQGSRVVDAAVETLKESGATPVKRGMCPTCMSAVRELEDGTVVLDDDENPTSVCTGSTSGHTLVS